VITDTEVEDMVSLRTARTGIAATIFVSTSGYAQHAPRIKIATDPPDTFNATAKSASMAIHDGTVTGDLAPEVAEQARHFIERNRAALLDYWEYRIDTAQLIDQLR